MSLGTMPGWFDQRRLKIAALRHVAELANHVGVASQDPPEIFMRTVSKRCIRIATAPVR
jgi:hypothetical protein